MSWRSPGAFRKTDAPSFNDNTVNSTLPDGPPLKNNIAPIVGTATAAAHRLRGDGITLLNNSTPIP